MLSAIQAERLRPLLDAMRDPRSLTERVLADPVEFPHRYRDPRDVEVVGLLSAALAYGRVELFKPKTAGLLDRLGPHPAATLQALDVPAVAELVDGFVYRFNVSADLAVLLMGMGAMLRRHGSLEAAFLEALDRGGSWRQAIQGFVLALRRSAPEAHLVRALGPTRGVEHLLPAADSGAMKRLNLYLRWMIRGADGVDLGVWGRLSPSQLVMPVDTHVARLSRWLGLTDRRTVGWAMAEEITASLRLLDAADPVKYDFALCHVGMSGACPLVAERSRCRACRLRPACREGRRWGDARGASAGASVPDPEGA